MEELPQDFLQELRDQLGDSAVYPEDYAPTLQGSTEEQPLAFDVVVVGAGAAGCAAAARLAEAGHLSVLLLEAGPDFPPEAEVPGLWQRLWQQKGLVWMYASEPRDDAFLGLRDRRTVMIRGKAVGGTSSINLMPYLRGHPRDYDSWGVDGWKFEDVLPFFKRFEDMRDDRVLALHPEFHGVGGEMTVEAPRGADPLKDVIMAAARELGVGEVIDFNGPPGVGVEGYGATHRTQRQGLRCGAAKAFLSKAGPGGKAGERLKLARRCTATRIHFHPDTKRVQGVNVLVAGTPSYVRVNKEVVLCAGALETPKLLMLSGVGPRNHLDEVGIPVVADLPVGSQLHDHAMFPAVFFAVPPLPASQTSMPTDPLKAFLNSEERTGPLASIGLMELMGFVRTASTGDWEVPSVQFNHARYPKGSFRSVGMAPEVEAAVKQLNADSDLLAVMPFLLHPKRAGEVRLRGADAAAPPCFHSGLLADPHDLEILLEGIRFVEDMAKTRSFREAGVRMRYVAYPGSEGLAPGSRAYWELALRQVAGSAFHPVASCAIGPIVDARLRVKGVEGVRVGDAAAIPSPVSANPNAPAIMFGERAAQFIIDEHVTGQAA